MKQEKFETLYNNDIKKEIKRKGKLLRTIIRINKPPIKETFLKTHELLLLSHPSSSKLIKLK